jgi:hypothetical protein
LPDKQAIIPLDEITICDLEFEVPIRPRKLGQAKLPSLCLHRTRGHHGRKRLEHDPCHRGARLFEERMKGLTAKLQERFQESDRLVSELRRNLRESGYGH